MDILEKYNILLVDDNKNFINVLRFYLMDIIRMPNYKIEEASNGHEALLMVRKKFYNIIFMDIDMPVMDGIEATRIIKSESPQTKIITLTLYNNPEYMWAMWGAGADEYILKDKFDETDILRFF